MIAVASTNRACGSSAGASRKCYAQKPPERNFRRHGRKIWWKFGKQCSPNFVLPLPGKDLWPQEISILRKSSISTRHKAKFFHRGTLGVGVGPRKWGNAQFQITSVVGTPQQDTKEYKSTYIRGVPTSEFSGSQKREDKGGGEEGRSGGRVNRAWRGERGENEGKRVGENGWKHTRKTLILVPLWFRYSLPPPPSRKLLTQKHSRGIIFGVIATLSRNQLRKRILWELFSRELREFRVTQHGRVWGLCSRHLRKIILGEIISW